MDWWADYICNIHDPLNPLCRDAQFLFCGFDAKHLNEVSKSDALIFLATSWIHLYLIEFFTLSSYIQLKQDFLLAEWCVRGLEISDWRFWQFALAVVVDLETFAPCFIRGFVPNSLVESNLCCQFWSYLFIFQKKTTLSTTAFCQNRYYKSIWKPF